MNGNTPREERDRSAQVGWIRVLDALRRPVQRSVSLLSGRGVGVNGNPPPPYEDTTAVQEVAILRRRMTAIADEMQALAEHDPAQAVTYRYVEEQIREALRFGFEEGRVSV